MPYQLLADLVLCVHLGFIVFVVLGGLLALRWRWMPWLHLPAAAWGAASELFGWLCPLTPFEQMLRHAGRANEYTVGFIEHYLLPLIYPSELTRGMQLSLGFLLIAINLMIYLYLWRYRIRR